MREPQAWTCPVTTVLPSAVFPSGSEWLGRWGLVARRLFPRAALPVHASLRDLRDYFKLNVGSREVGCLLQATVQFPWIPPRIFP